MLTDDDREEIRAIVRTEADHVIGSHFRAAINALSPVADVLLEVHKFGDLLMEISRSMQLVVAGQTRIESAMGQTIDPDHDEPWRQSLRDDD